MSRSWKTTTLGSLAMAGVLLLSGTAYGGEGAFGVVTRGVGAVGDGLGEVVGGGLGVGGPRPVERELWAGATIEPGREGIVEVGGYNGAALKAGSTLTLTAPAKTRVTGAPFAARGYRASVALGGGSATYTFVGATDTAREHASGSAGEPGAQAAVGEEVFEDAAAGDAAAGEAWKGRTFPFVLSVSPDAEPGTLLPDCTLVLRDAKGAVRGRGSCTVTVGLPAPTLSRPHSGVPLGTSPQASGTAYPGAQVTVRDAAENEVCATTAEPDGSWSCVPGLALTPGPGRLQATASLNGVSATSEQINIIVAGSGTAQPDTVSDSEGDPLRPRPGSPGADGTH
ncbi:carboxypeptidase regulatory-like domain-containing protein [Streptomyces sp. M41]|uniref:carboxypeptidase regulatory-like domain-containing protein n=1 Tax=Streptomyces sp. M41 TaxID=3059412 RepID=UPI00374C8DF0